MNAAAAFQKWLEPKNGAEGARSLVLAAQEGHPQAERLLRSWLKQSGFLHTSVSVGRPATIPREVCIAIYRLFSDYKVNAGQLRRALYGDLDMENDIPIWRIRSFGRYKARTLPLKGELLDLVRTLANHARKKAPGPDRPLLVREGGKSWDGYHIRYARRVGEYHFHNDIEVSDGLRVDQQNG